MWRAEHAQHSSEPASKDSQYKRTTSNRGFSFTIQQFYRAIAPLLKNLKIPVLMFLMVFSECRINEVTFVSLKSRSDGVMLETLMKRCFCLSERSVDMLDTLCGCDGSPPCMARMSVVEELQGPKLSDSRANQTKSK